jgi:hypothetical protein
VNQVAVVLWLAATLYALVRALFLIAAIARRVWRRSYKPPARSRATAVEMPAYPDQSAARLVDDALPASEVLRP